MKERCAWLDTLKGWGILFIVLGHIVGAGVHLSSGFGQTFCDAAYKYFYAFHVPLFFVVAGMTFRQREWKPFFIGKIQRLLFPYLLFGLFSIVVFGLFFPQIRDILTTAETTGYYQYKATLLPFWKQVANLFLGGWWPLGFAANSVLWFIPVLFSVEVVAQLCSRVLKVWWQWGLVAVVLYVLPHVIVLPQLPFGLRLVPDYLLYFVLGTFWGLKEIPCSRRWLLIVSALGLLLLFGGVAVWNPWQYFPRTIGQHGLKMILTCGCIGGWLCLSQCVTLRWIVQMGMWSLAIMLLHKFPVVFFQNFVSPIRNLYTGGFVLLLAGLLLVSLLSIGLTCLGCRCIQRFCPWLIGMKKKSMRVDA